jgi:glycosyltransferase involved in cell wall biosynthesis
VALLEALLAGLPAIASDIRGVSDLNGLNLPLFLIRNMSQESLTEEIIIWKNNDCKYKTSSNPKTELHRFGIEEVKKQLLDAYK